MVSLAPVLTSVVRVVLVTSPTPARIVRVGLAVGGGGTSIPLAQQLTEWTQSGAYQTTSIARDSNELATSATVLWPDGSGGVLTPSSYNAAFVAFDAYAITHTVSGKTITQAAVTRDAAGSITSMPALQVTP